jgi:5-hydroxyisourate hydrolase-like protein (transthyretin family)
MALAGAVLVGIAGSAQATQPPFEPDTTNQIGQIRFYDASGNPVTSGNIHDDPFAAYAVATADDPTASDNAATLYAYTPVQGQPATTWSGEVLSGTTSFPISDASAPAVVKNAGAHRPAVKLDTIAHGNTNLNTYLGDFPNHNTAGSGWENLYQLRILTAGDTKWWAADIQVDTNTGAWTLVYPLPADNTSLTIGSSTTINYGASTTVSTTLTDAVTHAALAGKTVKLYRKAPSASTWTFVANATTNSSGKASSAQKPTAKTQYRWQYAGDASHNASTSGTETVSVRQVVKASSTKSSVPHNVTFKIYGTVNPPSSGQKVTLQRQAGTKWNSIATVTIKKQTLPNGKTVVGFVFSVKQSTKGTFKYRVSKAATSTLLAGTSNTLTVKVT